MSAKTIRPEAHVADPQDLERRLKESQEQLRTAQSQLECAEKLAVLGGLVSEIAHEISTPLAALQSNTDTLSVCLERLKSSMETGSNRRQEIEEFILVADSAVKTSRLACERILNVVRSLRGPRLTEGVGFVRSNIHKEIDDSAALLAHVFRSRIRLFKDYGSLPEIECNPGRLSQVFLNLLVNAVQAIEGEGEIRVRTWQDGTDVNIAIRDTGKGIPSELKSRIFEQGFTTKGAEKGTGLGLSICRRIVRQHGGSIEVESEEGRGATFTVTLPIRQARERNTNDR